MILRSALEDQQCLSKPLLTETVTKTFNFVKVLLKHRTPSVVFVGPFGANSPLLPVMLNIFAAKSSLTSPFKEAKRNSVALKGLTQQAVD